MSVLSYLSTYYVRIRLDYYDIYRLFYATVLWFYIFRSSTQRACLGRQQLQSLRHT